MVYSMRSSQRRWNLQFEKGDDERSRREVFPMGIKGTWEAEARGSWVQGKTMSEK
jgi:hypothetical protein